MKLNTVRPHVESSGQMVEHFFSIKDTGMIFDILRNKMYSNPILAICREITSNARDAHREVGKQDIPVQIVLPNPLDWNYKVKDVGPGISPDRMVNIFISYTASTKREDNVQTGGFGLGAKTPFSYSDSFAIVTIHKGIKYQYNAYIDETKVGKISLMSEGATSEPSGTEIIIPVEPKDARFFMDWTEQACRHWTVRPIVKGGALVWREVSPILEGNGWTIDKSYDYNRQAKMVIDGIEYPLSTDALRSYAPGNTKIIDSCRGDIIMYFGVGELSLSASREQLYLDKNTQDKISQRLTELRDDIKKKLDQKIDSFPNLWQANLYYRRELISVFTDISFLGSLEWRGVKLHNGYISLDCPAFSFSRGTHSYRKNPDPDKLRRYRANSITFEENSELFINDLGIGEPTPRHVKKAFEDNKNLKNVQVICPTATFTEEKMNKAFHLDSMGARRLSDIVKGGRTYTASSARLLVFKFDETHNQFRQVSYDSMDKDTNTKILCLLDKEELPSSSGSRMPLLKKNQTMTLQAMRSVAMRSNGISFYGIDRDIPADRIKEEFEDFGSLENYVSEKIIDSKTINYVEIKYAEQHSYHVDEMMLQLMNEITPLIKNPASPFLKRLALHQKIKDINNGDTGILGVYESVKGSISDKEVTKLLKDNPEMDLDKINTQYTKRYPLMTYVSHYNYRNVLAALVQYINLIDQDQKV